MTERQLIDHLRWVASDIKVRLSQTAKNATIALAPKIADASQYFVTILYFIYLFRLYIGNGHTVYIP